MSKLRQRLLDFLEYLPPTPWLVAFDVDALRETADEAVLRAAWFLPQEAPLPPSAVVVLAADGRAVLGERQTLWQESSWPTAPTLADQPSDITQASMRDLYEVRLLSAPPDGLLCIGIGQLPSFAPVALLVRQGDGGKAMAEAVLDAPPDSTDYPLLLACGVKHHGTHWREGYHVARFSNQLPLHLAAGLASGLSRTHHCNLFFLRGARLDTELVEGLHHAAQARISQACAMALQSITSLALKAHAAPLCMTCLPPSPHAASPMGDIVPLGLLRRALLRVGVSGHGARAAAELLRRKLLGEAQQGLWSFQSGRLPTATDSALVLLGLPEEAANAPLARFTESQGAYLPQLASATASPGYMLATADVQHWMQADFGTTCTVRIAQREAGLQSVTPLAWLAARFGQRSGLFFANPYLVDWLLAEALHGDPAARELQSRLASEVEAAVLPSHGFGMWDESFSTSCAILALAACGKSGRVIRLAQLRLLELASRLGSPELATPFYSTQRLAPNEIAAPDHAAQLCIGTEKHMLTLYQDTFSIVASALRAMALAVSTDAHQDDSHVTGPMHPRYQAASLHDYVRRFALPPYLSHSAFGESP